MTQKNVSGTYSLHSTVWLYPGMAAWHFLTLPAAAAKEIKNLYGKNARGWGSLPVEVTIGTSTWNTSIFPDKKSASYLLPLNVRVRKAEGIVAGASVDFTVCIR